MTTAAEIDYLEQHGLYSPANEHDACGLALWPTSRVTSATTS